MALIKCSECGKEISDKSKTCVHCGNPLFQEKVKTMSKKKWEELSNDEKMKIGSYRKTLKQWWEINRVTSMALILISFIFLFIFFISGLNTIFMFIGFVPLTIGVILSINSQKEQKKWYEENIDKVYENEILK